MEPTIDSLPSPVLPQNGKTKSAGVDLGLALLSLANPPGPERQALTAREISEWCGCNVAAITSIERRAIAKLRKRLLVGLRADHHEPRPDSNARLATAA